ncbi:MAG TPA: hypothetical protein VGG42_06115, partial [Acidobacteriaceae bacterium]
MVRRWLCAGFVLVVGGMGAAPVVQAQQPFPEEPPQSQSKPQAEPFPGEPAQTPPQPSAAPSAPSATTSAKVDPRDPNLYLPTFRVSTSVVIVPTLVEKEDGEVLYGLKTKDFQVLDNGVPQKVQVDDDLDTQPVSLVVCVERG